jgi:hypothetical protein
MAEQATCHNCVYAHWDSGLWLRSLWSGFPAGPICANHPDSPGRLRECPCGPACRNYRPRPPVPEGDAVRTIPLGHGLYAYVDADDHEWLSRWTWHAFDDGYPARYEKHKKIYMHRQILPPPKGKMVDHIDGNRANNCRANLRICRRCENMRNNRAHRDSSSRYKGVSFVKARDKYAARIWFEGEDNWLGWYEDEMEAARAYDRAAVERFGEFARLNFPDEWPASRRAEVHAQWQNAPRKPRRKKSAGKPRRPRRKPSK